MRSQDAVTAALAVGELGASGTSGKQCPIMGAMRTVGVEEELLVVDPAGTPVPRGPQALKVAAAQGHGETVEEHDRAQRSGEGQDTESSSVHLVPELKAQQLELGTSVCVTLAEVDDQLLQWRRRADAAAVAVGARVAALASSPVDVEPMPTSGQRYRTMLDAFGVTARDQLTNGCHVHVSIGDAAEGIEILNRIRIWLPLLTALTANSPFWLGRDTGYASFRSQAWNWWPSAGPNELFADAGEYARLVDDVLATGTVVDAGMIYFDARLSTTWPTVEVRVADVALYREDAVTLAGLVRGVVETAARQARDGRPVPAVRSELIRLAAWRAGRSGLTGELVHPLTGRPAPAVDVLDALLDHVRAALADAGDAERVADGVAAVFHRGTGSDLQRRVFEETGDLTAVVRAAVTVTADQDGGAGAATGTHAG